MSMHSSHLEKLKEHSLSNPIIAFDGECILCNRFIQWIIKRDKKQKFHFVTLQSASGKLLSESIESGMDTVILLHDGKVYTESDVSLQSAGILGGGYKIFLGLKIIPKFFRNIVYRLIAKNRYRWFGKYDTCMIPDESLKARFL